MVTTFNRLLEFAINRINKTTNRDREFLAQFGSWTRPKFARRYDLEKMQYLIDWGIHDKSILDVVPFIKNLAFEDRIIAGEIARFCEEEIHDKFATDKNLKIFRLSFIRRLDACGF